jgi:hypothetical protein
MFLELPPLRSEPRQSGVPRPPGPREAAAFALLRVRKLLGGFFPGLAWDAPKLRAALGHPLHPPHLERERLFALGWLGWLEDGDASPLEDAEALGLAAGDDASTGFPGLPPLEPHLLLARCAYWRARVRLRRGEEAIAPYEAALKKMGGYPQAVVWLVDLLWRAGRAARAEQVWKSARGSRRVQGCDEGPLLDARIHLSRGEMGPAEKALRSASPASGPAWCEMHLLLAWAQANPRRASAAEEELRLASTGPYPPSALGAWRAAIQARAAGSDVLLPLPPGWPRLLDGPLNAEALRAAAELPALEPFARHALAALGDAPPTEALAPQLPTPLAPLFRARLALARFLRREASPAEALEAVQLFERSASRTPLLAHVRSLATALQSRPPTPEALIALIEREPEGPARRNAQAVAAEAAEKHLTPEAMEALLPHLGGLERPRIRHALATRSAEALGSLDTPAARLARHALGDGWPGELPPSCRPLAQALALHDRASRGDVAGVSELLHDLDAWRGLTAPPSFVLDALAALAPAAPSLRGTMTAWASLWAGTPVPGEDDAPPGVEPAAWWRHLAARALSQGRYLEAWRYLSRAGEAPAEAAPLRLWAEADALELALPAGSPRAARLTGLAELLREAPGGPAILDAALAGDVRAVRKGLADLDGDLPTPLHHGLAILAWREAQDDEDAAPRAWRHWRKLLPTLDDGPRRALLDHLFAWHRERIEGHLAREKLEAARRHWSLVHSLATASEEMARRVEAFADQLATSAIVQAREAMRHGDAPPGWRSAYERGLAILRRLLSLARDNVRLLTAIITACVEWLTDLYNLGDYPAVREQASRHLPLASQLGRLVEGGAGNLASRTALADYARLRGMAASSPEERARLFREGLKWDPANEGLKDHLSEMGVDDGQEAAHEG